MRLCICTWPEIFRAFARRQTERHQTLLILLFLSCFFYLSNALLFVFSSCASSTSPAFSPSASFWDLLFSSCCSAFSSSLSLLLLLRFVWSCLVDLWGFSPGPGRGNAEVLPFVGKQKRSLERDACPGEDLGLSVQPAVCVRALLYQHGTPSLSIHHAPH